ncbi:hypothetical protein V8F06_006073 [Rhypophila decipiens]
MSLLINNLKVFFPWTLLLLLAGWDADEAGQRTERAWETYNLPYGTLGIITHIIMLWTLACHLDGRSPAMPWERLKFDVWNMALLGVTTIVSISLLAVSLSAKGRSPGMTSMAVLHLVYSLVVDGFAAHRYFRDGFRKMEFQDSSGYGLTSRRAKLSRYLWPDFMIHSDMGQSSICDSAIQSASNDHAS